MGTGSFENVDTVYIDRDNENQYNTLRLFRLDAAGWKIVIFRSQPWGMHFCIPQSLAENAKRINPFPKVARQSWYEIRLFAVFI